MRRSIYWAVQAATVAVVVTLGELHAHLVGHYPFGASGRMAWMVTYCALLLVAAYAVGVPDVPRTTVGAAWSAAGATVGAALVISAVQLVVGSLLLPRFVVFGSALTLFVLYAGACLVSERIRRHDQGADRVLVVARADDTEALRDDLVAGTERPVRLVAALTPAEAMPGTERGAHPVVAAVAEHQASVVVLDRSAQDSDAVVAQAAQLHASGVRIRTLTLFYDEWLGKLPIGELERVSLMFDIQEVHAQRYARLKRSIDLALALGGLVAFVGVVPLVWVLDRVGNRGPLFFRQERVGKHGRVFRIWKFRTMPPMPPGAEQAWTEERDVRITAVGRLLRQLHVDEIPQVLNILRGELSVVGPRPEQPRYVAELARTIPFYEVRHLVQPGLTGWAQVKFRYGASVKDAMEKLQYEFFYLRHQGVALDVRIIARTLRSVVARRGR